MVISDNNLGDDGAVAIAEALKTNNTLTNLNLSSGQYDRIKIGPKGARALASMLEVNAKVTTLDLGGNHLCGTLNFGSKFNLASNQFDEGAKDAVRAAWKGQAASPGPTTAGEGVDH